jgi:hypothetical protein
MVHFKMQETVNCPSSKMEQITIPLHIFHKNKLNDHEISYNGKMYDFKSFQLKGDYIELLAIHDKEEENILDEIAGFFNRKAGNNSTLPDKVMKLLTLDYLAPGTFSSIFTDSYKLQIFHPFIFQTTCFFQEISSPPPQSV